MCAALEAAIPGCLVGVEATAETTVSAGGEGFGGGLVDLTAGEVVLVAVAALAAGLRFAGCLFAGVAVVAAGLGGVASAFELVVVVGTTSGAVGNPVPGGCRLLEAHQ